MPDWGWIVIAGLLVVVLTPFAKHIGEFVFRWTVTKPLEIMAVAIVREINGQLGLPAIRDQLDRVEGKVDANTDRMEKTRLQVTNLEGQIEPFLTN